MTASRGPRRRASSRGCFPPHSAPAPEAPRHTVAIVRDDRPLASWHTIRRAPAQPRPTAGTEAAHRRLDDTETALLWIFVGLISGWLASRIAGSSLGVIGEIVVGIVGAFVGGLLFRELHFATPFGGLPGTIFVAFVGALVLLSFYGSSAAWHDRRERARARARVPWSSTWTPTGTSPSSASPVTSSSPTARPCGARSDPSSLRTRTRRCASTSPGSSPWTGARWRSWSRPSWISTWRAAAARSSADGRRAEDPRALRGRGRADARKQEKPLGIIDQYRERHLRHPGRGTARPRHPRQHGHRRGRDPAETADGQLARGRLHHEPHGRRRGCRSWCSSTS